MRRALLIAALLLAVLLRWPLASHDVSHYVGPDEGEVVENVLEMLRMGDFDHRHRGYPGFHFYLQMVPLALHRAAEGRPIPELPRSGFYLVARRMTLVAGVAAALVVFAAGRRFLSGGASLLAAGLVLASPLASRESAVVNPDLMLSFFTAASLLCSLRLLSDRRLGSFVLAGASVGLAAAVKYTGGLALVPYLCAWALPPLSARKASTTGLAVDASESARRAVAGLAAAAVVFVLASPYTLVHLDATLEGLGTHASYYNARGVNGAVELLSVLFSRGLGPPATLAALAAATLALARREPHRLVVASFPVAYLLVFALFGRAFPRHALVLLPPLALLAGSAWEALTARRSELAPKLTRGLVAALLLAAPLWGSIDLARRALRPTPAERAKLWAEAELPQASRVLEDQFTPALDPERLRTHRIRVEERVFLGNYDFALVSGYPPGIETGALRELRRFEPEDALGDAVVLYQIPPRETLMPVTLPLQAGATREVGAGELPFFGEGWHPPAAGAYETSRLSEGESSELFFVLPRARELPDLEAALTLGPAVARSELEVIFEINGRAASAAKVGPSEREVVWLTLRKSDLVTGANRLVLRYSATERLSRRRPETAVRLYRFALTWKSPGRPR